MELMKSEMRIGSQTLGVQNHDMIGHKAQPRLRQAQVAAN
jgi:hypothetical protein